MWNVKGASDRVFDAPKNNRGETITNSLGARDPSAAKRKMLEETFKNVTDADVDAAIFKPILDRKEQEIVQEAIEKLTPQSTSTSGIAKSINKISTTESRGTTGYNGARVLQNILSNQTKRYQFEQILKLVSIIPS